MRLLQQLKHELCSCVKLFVLFSFGFVSFPSFSQILSESNNTVRVFDKTASVFLPYVDSTSVGNYGVLDPKSGGFVKFGKELASKSSGTMFLVVRPKLDTLPSGRLLRVGPISLYSDSLKIDGRKIDIEPITNKPVIVKVKYQAKPRKSWLQKMFKIEESIDLAEVIYFEEQLSNEQIRKVETLLSLKYSIKIDKICDKKLPDYVSLAENQVWNYRSDSDYDKQIMGLGRFDKASFFQSQSYSADSRSVKIALDTLMDIGENSNVFVQDSALLVISQGSDLLKSQCGGNPADFLFKLKLFNWVSDADTLLVKIDTVLAYNTINLSNGINYHLVDYKIVGGQTILGIPLAGLSDETNYFVVGMAVPDTCDPLYNLQFSHCDSSGQNTILLNIEPSALPADCKIVNLTTGVVLDTVISSPNVTINNITAGNYELFVSNEYGSIVHSLYNFNTCLSSLSSFYQTGNTASTFEAYGFDYNNIPETSSNYNGPQYGEEGYGGSSGSRNTFDTGQGVLDLDGESLLIYPNPIRRGEELTMEFRNLDEETFTIQVIDNKGALLHEGVFTPVATNNTYSYQIDQPGTFMVRAVSSGFSSVQTIVVK